MVLGNACLELSLICLGGTRLYYSVIGSRSHGWWGLWLGLEPVLASKLSSNWKEALVASPGGTLMDNLQGYVNKMRFCIQICILESGIIALRGQAMYWPNNFWRTKCFTRTWCTPDYSVVLSRLRVGSYFCYSEHMEWFRDLVLRIAVIGDLRVCREAEGWFLQWLGNKCTVRMVHFILANGNCAWERVLC